jgi:hypothetical protein
VKARRYGIWAGLAIVAAITSGALLAQAPQAIGTWVSVGEVSSPLINGASVALPDKRTLIAGGALTDGTFTDAVTIYDSVDNSATAAGALTSARADHTATLLKDGRVLVVGGMTADGLVSSDIEIFDPATGTSTIVALLPEPRNGHVAAGLPDGSVLITAGATVDGTMLQTAVLFDPATASVSSVPGHLHTARMHASATTLLDGRVLVAGGSNGTMDLASAEIYDRYTQSFSIAATQMSVGRQGHSAVLLPHNGGVLVAGGTSNEVAQAGVDLFLPAVFPDPFSYGEGEFVATGEMTAARTRAVAGPTSIEGFAFAAAGGAPDAEVYRFATIKTDKDDYAPGELAVITGSGWEANEEVTLTFQEDPAVHDDYVLKVKADGSGNIYWNKWAPERHDLGVRFYLTATGSASRAQTTFTDGLKVTVKPNNQVLTVASGATTPVTFEIHNDNNGSDSNNPITVTYVLTAAASLSVSGDPVTNTVTLVNSSALATLHFNVTAPAGPASGLNLTLTATISSCPTANCSDSGKYTFDVTAPTDSTPPVISPTLTGTLGSNGWYRSDVTVTWTVTDPESMITSSPCGNTTITSDTTGTAVTCSATSAGGTSTQSVTIKRDATAPSVTATRTPGANANGWNNTDVTVTFAGTDTVSGPVTCDAALVLGEGANKSATGSCTDLAGNSASATVSGINIDKTAPTITAQRDTAANANGWNNGGVIASYSASDALSGLDSAATGIFTFTAEGAGQSHAFTVTDLAGNSASDTVSDVNIDTTVPNVTATPSPAANADGWNSSDVTVIFAGTDTLSGIATCDTAAVLSSEGENMSATGSCLDRAGNSASASVSGIKIDKTAPSITASRVTPANSYGWNNTDVTISYIASDALSLLNATSPANGSFTFTAEGAGQSHTFTVTDLAGNSASDSVSDVNIDKTAPIATATPAPAANTNGWNNTDVTVTFAGTDALSGIDSCQDPTVLSTEGANQSASGSCTDKAGNSAPVATASGINIDKTAPTITGGRLPVANAFGWNNSDVTATYEATDALSGFAGWTYGNGSHTFTAEGAGQSYTFAGTDKAGNSASATVSDINIDKTAPILAPVVTPSPVILNGTATATPNATDMLSGIQNQSCPAVSTGSVGPQTLTCTATDKADNVGSSKANYSVNYSWQGFLQPINDTAHQVGATQSKFKLGQTVPAKFVLRDAAGVSVQQESNPAFLISGNIGACASYATLETTDAGAPDTLPVYKWDGAQYHFNWSTKGLSGGVYRIYAKLADGNQPWVDICLTK